MATDREAKPAGETLPRFVKFKKIGQKIAGRVKKFATNDAGPFLILAPAFVADEGEKWGRRYAELPIPLTADLLRKVESPDDVNKVLLIVFRDTEQTERGNEKKIFGVSVLDPSEIETLRARCTDKGSAVGIADIFGAR